MLAIPVIGFLAGLIPLAIVWVPAGLLWLNEGTAAGIVLAVLGIFANQIVLSIAGGGLVAATDSDPSGRESSIGHGIARSLAHLILLIGWALITSVVTVIVGFLRGNNQNRSVDAPRSIAVKGILTTGG